MKRLLVIAAVTAIAAVPVRLVLAQAAPPVQEQPLDPIVLAWDSGPDKIDVSRYSAEMKKKYKIFQELCGRCHPVARAINCDFALESDWERYIKKMMRRGRSLITPEQALQSYEFAVYDSKIRKRELYEKKLKETQR